MKSLKAALIIKIFSIQINNHHSPYFPKTQLGVKAGQPVTRLVDGIHHDGVGGLFEHRPTHINKLMGQL